MNLLNALIPSLNRSAVTREESRTDSLGPTVKPHYEVTETAEAFGLTVFLPGVAKDGLEVTAADNHVRVVGKRAWTRPAGWTALYRETAEATFVLELQHDNAVDVDQSRAELRDGVLRLSLPKAEAVKPRKIAIN